MASRTIKKNEKEKAEKNLTPKLSNLIGQKIKDIGNDGNELVIKFSNGYEIYITHHEPLTMAVRES